MVPICCLTHASVSELAYTPTVAPPRPSSPTLPVCCNTIHPYPPETANLQLHRADSHALRDSGPPPANGNPVSKPSL